MLTNPNTLGLFDENIAEIASIVHDVGGTLYYDGANLNAIMGFTRPGDMGFDIVHLNLHKSFSQPHGGGGPGSGPIAVSDRIAPFLPAPRIVRVDSRTAPEPRLRLSGGQRRRRLRLRLLGAEVDRAPAGVPGQLRRLRPLLRLHLEPRRRRPSRGLRDSGPERQLPAREAAFRARRQVPAARLRAHPDARVRPLGRRPRSASSRSKTLDLAKRLLDYGFHPPTIYFPLLVDEALMVEPTETETRESLDRLAEAIEEILAEAEEDPGSCASAVHDAGPPPRRGCGEPQADDPPAALALRAVR